MSEGQALRAVMMPSATVNREVAQLGAARAFQITRTGLRVNGLPSFEEAEEFGRQLATVEHAVQFTIGDFCEWLDAQFGERASQIIDEGYGWNHDSLKVYRWVAKNVPAANRRPELSFKHHQIVAKLPAAAQKRWLKEASDGDEGVAWTTQRLATEVREGGGTSVTQRWLLVLCKDGKDRDDLQAKLEGEGRTVKGIDKRAKAKQPKQVTARAKNVGKKKGRSRG